MTLFSSDKLIVLAVLTLAGCGSSVSHQLDLVIDKNKSATSIVEWEQSDATPEAIFKKWREEIERSDDADKNSSLEKSICGELLSLGGLELSLFENEIKEAQNQKVVGICQGELVEKVDKYYLEQNKILNSGAQNFAEGPTAAGFQFQVNVQKRDTSHGYVAFTGDVAKKEVILTFDDGPSAAYTEKILKALRDVNAKAVFFELGKNIRINPEIVKMVASDGHSIGTHTVNHACLGPSAACKKTNGHTYTFEEGVREIVGGHQALYDVLGWVDPFFRFPYGERSDALKNYLANNSIGEFLWNIDSEDWKAQSNAELISKTLSQLDARQKGIILFHDIQRRTSEILPTFLRELYFRGYSVVLIKPIDENARFNSKIVRKKNVP